MTHAWVKLAGGPSLGSLLLYKHHSTSQHRQYTQPDTHLGGSRRDDTLGEVTGAAFQRTVHQMVPRTT